jgi:hypothetical protein
MKFEATYLSPEAKKIAVELIQDILIEHQYQPTQEEIKEMAKLINEIGYTESPLVVAAAIAFSETESGEKDPFWIQLLVLCREFLYLRSTNGALTRGIKPPILGVFKESKSGHDVLAHELQHAVDDILAIVLPDLEIPTQSASMKKYFYFEVGSYLSAIFSSIAFAVGYYNRELLEEVLAGLVLIELIGIFAVITAYRTHHNYVNNELEQRARKAGDKKNPRQ